MDEVGQVFVSVKEGRSLGITEPTDVYCIIQLEQQKVRTSICSRVSPGGRAEWNEGYTFDVTTDADISVKVWGKSPSAPRGRLLGSLTISTSTAKNRPPVEAWQALSPPPQAPTPPVPAELYFRTSYVNSTNKVGFEDFTILKLIGKGAFGKVMLVRKNDTGRLYAMKQLDKDHVLSLAAVTFTLTERHVLKTYNHPFVVSLKYSFQTKSSLFMVLDYVGGGELFYHMAERGVFDEDTVRFYAAQIVLALGFLHDHGVTYRDLKPENLLLDIHGNICLCDFGLCKEQVDGENTFTLCGSPEYMAPEVLQGRGYGRSVDWWALGILIYEMLTGLPPFYSEDAMEMSQNILTAPIHFPDHLSKNIMSLIVQLLKRDPARRLGSGPGDAEDIKAHPFFAPVDWKRILRKEIEPPFKPHLTGAIDVTYFDPNCTEAPVGSVDIRQSPGPTDPEDCFAQFSFVAPAEFGSTPHGSFMERRKQIPTPSFSQLGALHSSSPIFPSQHSSPHTPPAFSHPLAGMGIPRSPATFSLSSLSSLSHSPHSHSHSPHSHSPSPHALSIIASSSPRGSFSMESGFEERDRDHGLVREAPAALQHSHSSDDDVIHLPNQDPTSSPPGLPNSHSNPSLNSLTKPKPSRPPLWTSASTPNLFAREDEEEEEAEEKVVKEKDKGSTAGSNGKAPNKKTFKAIMSSVFRKIK